MLSIKSQSLVNLSLRKVGVTDLVIDECPRLQILSGKCHAFLHTVLQPLIPTSNNWISTLSGLQITFPTFLPR